MKHLFEIFEQFPDHSSLWRESALGTKKAQRKLMEMGRRSANPIYAIDLTSGEVLRITGKTGPNEILTESPGNLEAKLSVAWLDSTREK
jgi:hypothetical protein